MSISALTVFAQNGEKNTTGLVLLDGLPENQKPARQWFNWLFNTITTKINELVSAQNNNINNFYRVGMVVEFATDEDPNDIWTGTTWIRFAEGRTTVGQLDGDDDFGVIGDTGGSKTQSLDEEQMPPHVHGGVPLKQVQTDRGTGSSIFSIDDEAFTDSAGGLDGVAQPFSILQPFVVTAKWLRTA